MSLRLPVKAYSLVAVPLVFELIFVSVLVFFQGQLEQAYAKEIQARKLSGLINRALADCLQAGTYAALGHISNDHLLIKEAQSRFKGLRRVRIQFQEVRGLNDRDQKSVDEIGEMIESIFRNFPDLQDVKQKDRTNFVVSLHVEVQDLIDAANDFLERQDQVQASQSVEQQKLRTFITNSVIVGVVFNVILAVVLVYFFNQSIVRRLQTVILNAHRLASGEELLPRVEGLDEVADLDKMFHYMAGSLESATAREKAILENSSDVIFSLDSLLEMIFVSAAARRLWGYDPDSLAGKEIDVVVWEEDLDKVRSELLDLRESKSSATFEARIKRENGELVDASWSAFYSSEKEQIFCVAHDISDRRALERQKEDFLSMVSHDLRSPLTSLSLTFEMLLAGALGKLNENGSELVERSNADIIRLKRLVTDLLDADRLEKGKMEILVKECQSSLVREMVLNSVEPQAKEKNIEIKTDWQEVTLRCDKDRVIQILVNLLGNAIKFSDKGTSIEMNLRLVDNLHEFEVIDKGRGISKENQERIFDKFRQVSAEDATLKGGSGLGLAICKALVTAHKGEIGVESEPGKGSRFWFRIPGISVDG